ncbi:MAG: SDR family oxidoreductase [archaeon]|nr:SDR family oxidoreductase [archaeon]
MAEKTVLVAGGAGFVGSHLCEKLLDENCRVICFDSLITGKKENLPSMSQRKNFKFIKGDISKKVPSLRIDGIFNLASPASPVDYQKRPIETLFSGSLGVKNLLDLARKNDAVFLQASTSEIYGDPLEHPQKESYYGNVNPVGPRSCYDESKRFAEALTTNYCSHYSVETRIARIFNTYGPRMRKDDGRVIPNFVMQALKNGPLTVYGDGSQTRSFCFVDDLVCGLLSLMKSGYTLPVNLGNPDERTIFDTAKKIISLTGSSSKISFAPLPKDDPLRRRPDISLASEKLGWKPVTGFDKGLKSTVEWFRTNPGR